MRVPGRHEHGQAGAAHVAALLVAFLAGVLGGALAAAWITPSAAAPAGDDEALARALGGLEATLARLGAQLDRLERSGAGAGPVPSAAPEPLTPGAPANVPAPDLAALVAGLEQLAQAVRAQATRPSWTGTSPAIAAPMLAVPPAAPPRARLDALAGLDWTEVRRQHLFWSYQQLLETYGVPDDITLGDGYLTWMYETTDGNYMGFRLFDGMVMGFWN